MTKNTKLKIEDDTRLMNADEVCMATRLEEETLSDLVVASLFPSPVHLNPPLWSEPSVEAWVIAAAEVAGAKVA